MKTASNRYKGVSHSIIGTWPVNDANWEVEPFALKVFQWHCDVPFIENSLYTRVAVCGRGCACVYHLFLFILNKLQSILSIENEMQCALASLRLPEPEEFCALAWNVAVRRRERRIDRALNGCAEAKYSSSATTMHDRTNLLDFLKEWMKRENSFSDLNIIWVIIIWAIRMHVFEWSTDVRTGRILLAPTFTSARHGFAYQSCAGTRYTRLWVCRWSIFSDNRPIRPIHSQQ